MPMYVPSATPTRAILDHRCNFPHCLPAVTSFTIRGGPNAQYQSNNNVITTICPPHDGIDITVTFNLFNTQSCCDFLTVFDGPNTNGSILGSFSGSQIPDPITSDHSSGCLTFQFSSDGTNAGNGWEALVSCDPLDSSAKNSFAGRFDVFPNPTSSELNVLFEYPSAGKAFLEIKDVTGQLVSKKSLVAFAGNNQAEFNLENMPCGIYFVSLKGAFGRAVKRVVKITD